MVTGSVDSGMMLFQNVLLHLLCLRISCQATTDYELWEGEAPAEPQIMR
jgi:hypothetical protein